MNAYTVADVLGTMTTNDNSPALIVDLMPAPCTPVDGKLARLLLCCPDAVVGVSEYAETDRLADDHCVSV